MVSSPILQIGESAISYPMFNIEPYFFQPGKFLGSIEYLAECSTVSPTQDKRDRTPSIAPVEIPTDEPTVSMLAQKMSDVGLASFAQGLAALRGKA